MSALLLCGIAHADDTVVPGSINLQFQAQVPEGSTLKNPDGMVRFTVLDSDQSTTLFTGTSEVMMETNGVFNVQISDPAVKTYFTEANGAARYIRLDVQAPSGSYLTGDPMQVVAAPYVYYADKLEKASGNFNVGGNLEVTGDVHAKALSVPASTSGVAEISGTFTCRGKNNTSEPVWVKTNTYGAGTLTFGGDTTIEGSATFQTDVTIPYMSTFEDAVTVAGNIECSAGAEVHNTSPGFGAMSSVQASGTPPHGKPGFLLVYMKVTDKHSGGMTVKIGENDKYQYELINYQDVVGINDGYQCVSYCFFVRGDSRWTVTPGSDVSATTMWVDLY